MIASFNVATGCVDQASVWDTRTKADLNTHLRVLVAQSPEIVKRHLVMDCLNAHRSETVVQLAAELNPEPIDLREKGKSGILQSMTTRTTFLTDPAHHLGVHFIPKHCSWLNQIEI